MGYIINLIAKAFLLSNKSETWESKVTVAENSPDFEGAMRL